MNPIDFFDKCRFWGGKRISLLQKIRFYGVINRFVEFIANFTLPLYFEMTKNKEQNSLPNNKSKESPKVIVSLTSFPKRIPTLHLVVESLLRQRVKPDKVILYLTKSQIRDLNTLPTKLLEQRKRGLEIVLCPDEIRSHTKYYYAFRDYPNDIIITVDDDLFYRSDLIETHLNNLANNPDCVISNWVKEIIPGKDKYTEWPDLHDSPKLGKNHLILGVSSVLYPPHAVHSDIFNIENIKKLTLTCDDIWITAMLLKQNTYIYYSAYQYNHLPVSIKDNQTLISGNYVRNQQAIDAIDNYYAELGEKRPFRDLPKSNS